MLKSSGRLSRSTFSALSPAPGTGAASRAIPAAIRQDRDRQQRGVARARRADRQRAHRNPARHLHRREQRIHALQRRAFHRHAEHRQQRVRRANARQMRRAAGRRDDTSTPRDSAWPTYSAVSAGVRCAESTRHSCGTPNFVSISSAWRMVSQSDLLPMMTATSGFASPCLLSLRQRESGLAVVIAQISRVIAISMPEPRPRAPSSADHLLRRHRARPP